MDPSNLECGVCFDIMVKILKNGLVDENRLHVGFEPTIVQFTKREKRAKIWEIHERTRKEDENSNTYRQHLQNIANYPYDPMVLRCGHSFCELCAEESINFSDKCPLCRQKSVGICIFNRCLDQCIQSWIASQERAVKEAYRQRVAQYSKILLLKNKARIILWTVISRSRNEGVKISEVETLYNKIQRELGREAMVFEADLREQIRREALLHDGCFFKLFKDEDCSSFEVRLLNP